MEGSSADATVDESNSDDDSLQLDEGDLARLREAAKLGVTKDSQGRRRGISGQFPGK